MTNEIVPADVAVSANGLQASINAMKSGGSNVMSTFTGSEHADKLKVIAAMTAAVPVADNLGKTIKLSNVVIQPIEMADDNTGELTTVPRIILVDADGTSYSAISSGIFRSLENIFGILGQPSEWPEPLEVHVSEARSRAGFRFMTLNIGSAPKK